MMKSPLSFGVGMAVLIALNTHFTFESVPSEDVGGLLTPILMLAAVFVMVYFGIRQQRQQAGGDLSYARAMKTGLFIGLVGGVLTGGFFYYYFSVVNPDFAPQILDQQHARFLADSLDAETIDERLFMLRRQFSPGGQFFSNMASVLFFSLIFSIVSSFMLTRGFQHISDRPVSDPRNQE